MQKISFLWITTMAYSLVFTGCAVHSKFYGPPEFQGWMRQALEHPDATSAFHRFYLAYQGKAVGLHAYFEEALRQANLSEIDVEAGEGLSFELETIVRRAGDQRFAEALSSESPEVRSAVACNMHLPGLSVFPKTQRLLKITPKIDFPMLRTYGAQTDGVRGGSGVKSQH